MVGAEAMVSAVSPADLDNSKDIGKLAQRVGTQEMGIDHLTSAMARIEKAQAESKAHELVLCNAAQLAIFGMKVVLPAAAAGVGLYFGLQKMGIMP